MTTQWPAYRLKHLVRPIVDKVTVPAFEGPYIGLEAIKSWTGEIDPDMSEETGDSLGNRFRRGDVLFGKLRPYLAKVSAPDFEGHCSGEALVLRPSSRIHTRFLRYRLVETGTIDAVNASTYGAKMPRASWDFIGNLRFGMPDRETQKAIADFLDRETARIDQLIEKKQRLVQLLREKQKAFAAEEATGANLPEKSDTGLGQLPLAPSQWRVRRIAAVFRESFEMGGENLPVLSVSINWGISDRELDDEDRHRIVTHIEDRNAYKRVRVGDLVYNMMRAWQGAFGVAKVDGLVSPAYVVARPSEEIHAPFFEHLLRTPMWIEEFRRSSKGIADFRQRLYWEHFRQVGIVLPPLEVQVEIANRIAANDAAIEAVLSPIRVSIDRLKEFRSTLITAAVTGQIDVKTWGAQGQTDRRLDQIEEDMTRQEACA